MRSPLSQDEIAQKSVIESLFSPHSHPLNLGILLLLALDEPAVRSLQIGCTREIVPLRTSSRLRSSTDALQMGFLLLREQMILVLNINLLMHYIGVDYSSINGGGMQE